MKYKVGDIVRVRNDLKYGIDNDVNVNENMIRLAGLTTRITKADNLRRGRKVPRVYHIDLDCETWCWTDNMFEPVNMPFELNSLL